MRKFCGRIGCLVLILLLCAACGKVMPDSNQPTDYSGTYTDTQGTGEVYSSLELRKDGDGGYSVLMSLYRLALLEGTADGELHFVSGSSTQPAVEADIVIDGDGAEVSITKSEFPGISAGTVFQFPDGKMD